MIFILLLTLCSAVGIRKKASFLPESLLQSKNDPAPVTRTVAAIKSGYHVSASSEFDSSHGARRARLDYPRPREGASCWSAARNDVDQWIAVDLVDVKEVIRIETQGRGYGWFQCVTAFKVQYSVDGIDWEYADNGKEYEGNTDMDSIVLTTFDTPFKARTVRIHPTKWNMHISLRWELYFTEESRLPDINVQEDSITVASVAAGFPVYASSEHDPSYSVARSRLDYPAPRTGSQSWSAGFDDEDQWIGANLGRPRVVTAIEIQGRGDRDDQWVREFTMEYSLDGMEWVVFRMGESACTVLTGNSDPKEKVLTQLLTPIIARTVRIHPKKWNKHISMRFEVYFNDEIRSSECDLDSDNAILVAAVASGYPVSASTEYHSNYGTQRIQLDSNPPRQPSQAWSAAEKKGSQWVGVNVVEPKRFRSIETQGRGDIAQWVMEYKVSYSNDGVNWTYVDEGRIFEGNQDQTTKVLQEFQKPFTARAVRMHPIQWYNWISVRLEFYFDDNKPEKADKYESRPDLDDLVRIDLESYGATVSGQYTEYGNHYSKDMLPNLINCGTDIWYANSFHAHITIEIGEPVWIGGIGFKSSDDSKLTDDKMIAMIFVEQVGQMEWVSEIYRGWEKYAPQLELDFDESDNLLKWSFPDWMETSKVTIQISLQQEGPHNSIYMELSEIQLLG